jgi:hypothetical protein
MSFCIYIQDYIDNILYKCKSKIHVGMISNVCNLLPCPKIDAIFTKIIIVILSAISYESKWETVMHNSFGAQFKKGEGYIIYFLYNWDSLVS